MITMKDVARMAGVSQATVSYAYSRPDKISKDQREFIMKTAEELGYPGPHIAGQLLKNGRIGAVGLMVTGTLSYAMTDPSAQMVLKGIAEVGEFRDMPLTILPLQENETSKVANDGKKQPIPTSSPVLRGLVDGLIVYAVPESNKLFNDLVRRKIPLVAIDGPLLHGVPYVTIDDVGATFKMMRHLLGLGHRNIAIIMDRLTDFGGTRLVSPDQKFDSPHNVARNRLRGYLNALESFDIDLDKVTIVEAGGFDPDRARQAIDLVLEKTQPTLVVCMTDVQALSVGKRLHERGYDIPGDISLVGFDDNPSAEAFGLSTIRQPMIEKGRVAARMLMDLLGKSLPQNEILPTEMVLRATTGPVPTRARSVRPSAK